MFSSKIDRRSLSLGFILSCAFLVGSANGQGTLKYAYVSAVNGSDSNTCEQAFPCRNISRGISQVASGGTVFVVSSGEYFPPSITKSVSIIAESNVKAVLDPADAGTETNITSPDGSIEVVLRGLTIIANSTSVRVSNQNPHSTVTIEDCIIFDRATENGGGIYISSPGKYKIKNTQIRSSSQNLMFSLAGGAVGTIEAVVENCRFEKGTTGIYAGRGSNVIVRDSVSTNHTAAGFYATSGGRLLIDDCVSFYNYAGVRSSSEAMVSVNNSSITENSYGTQSNWSGSMGYIRSFQNNRIYLNKLGDVQGYLLNAHNK